MKQRLIKLFFLVVIAGGVISAIPISLNMDIGIDFYRNGFVLYDEIILMKFVTAGLLMALLATRIYFRSKTATTPQEENNIQIEADVRGRCNLPTHLHLKRT